MTKSNPLFVDSTKFMGDLIPTHIELRDILIYEDETLFVVVRNHQGACRRLAMRAMEERGYEARLHLPNQMPIVYQFVVEKCGKRLLSSPVRDGRAQYAIIDSWQPVLDAGDDLIVTETSEPASPAQPPATEAWARESVMNVKTLMEKWGL